MLPPLTNRSNNQVSSLPAIQPQKKQISNIKEINFEGDTPTYMEKNAFMNPYVDQFMSVHHLNEGGIKSPKDKILVHPGLIAGGVKPQVQAAAVHRAAAL